MIAFIDLLLAIGGKRVEQIAELGGLSMKLPDGPAAPLGQPEEVRPYVAFSGDGSR